MARYSLELRALIETFGRDEVKSWFTDYNLEDYLTADEINTINERGTWNKEKLADLILDHYFIHEIGFETPALFKHYANVAMREIMEEKLPLIYSAAIKYDPLVNVDFTETYSSSGKDNTTSNSQGNGLNIDSDTPQGKINKDKILAGDYASSTSANENKNNSNTQSVNNQNYTKNVKGNSGVSATAQKMVEQYRENIIMINRDIVKDLATLFMGIY